MADSRTPSRSVGRGRSFLVVAMATLIVVSACGGSDSNDAGGGGSAGGEYGSEVSEIRSAQEDYCKKTGHFGTGEELVEAKLLDEAPKLVSPAPIPDGTCGTSDRSGFALVCNQNDAGCKSAGGRPKGGTFVIGVSALTGENTLNPAVNSQGGINSNSALLFSGLVELDKAANPIPELASGWEVKDGGSVYEFSLRPGVKWSDGMPFTAADVKFSYEAALLGPR